MKGWIKKRYNILGYMLQKARFEKYIYILHNLKSNIYIPNFWFLKQGILFWNIIVFIHRYTAVLFLFTGCQFPEFCQQNGAYLKSQFTNIFTNHTDMMIRLPWDNLLYSMKRIHVSQQKLICKGCVSKK